MSARSLLHHARQSQSALTEKNGQGPPLTYDRRLDQISLDEVEQIMGDFHRTSAPENPALSLGLVLVQNL